MEIFRSHRFRTLLIFLSIFFGKGFAVPFSAAAYGKYSPSYSHLRAVSPQHSKSFKAVCNGGVVNLDQDSQDVEWAAPSVILFSENKGVAWEAACLAKRSDFVFPKDSLLSKNPVYLLHQNFRL